DRLDQIIISAKSLAIDNVPWIAQRRQEQEWNFRMFLFVSAQRLKDAIAIQPRHGDVAQNQIGALGFQYRERFSAIASFDDLIACLDQLIPDVAAQLRFVLDAEDHVWPFARGSRRNHAGSCATLAAATTPDPQALHGSIIAMRTVPGSEACKHTSPPCRRASAFAI